MTTYRLAAFGPAKINRARHCDATDYCVISATGGSGRATTYTVGVYVDEADARAVHDHLAPGADAAATKAAFDAAVLRRKHQEVGVSPTVLKGMVADVADFEGPPVHPLVGTTVRLTVPVWDSTGAMLVGTHTGDVHVDGAHATLVDAFHCSFTFGGATHNQVLAKTVIETAAAAPPPPPPPPPRASIKVAPIAVGPKIVELIRALPHSKALAADYLDVDEAMDTLVAAGVTVAVTDPSDAAFGVSLACSLARLSIMVASAPAARIWPNLHADRLGKEIKREHDAASGGSGGGGASAAAPSRFPLTDALQKLASSSAEWVDFLSRSISITFDTERHEKAASSDYLKMGAIEQYLKRGATVELITSHSAEGSLSVDMLMALLMYDFKPPVAGVASTSAPPAPSHLNVNVVPTDLSGSDDERRLRLTLREDYEKLNGSDASKATLDSLHTLVNSPVDLAQKVREISDDDGLKRLVTTENDVEKALAGTHTPLPSPHASCLAA